MPTYEYACTACANQWEEVQKISEDPLDTCPKCSQKTAKRQISGGNFILKGGGWYADLYSSTGNKKSDSSKSDSNGASSSDTSATKTTKTEKTSPAPSTSSSGSSGSTSSGGSSSGSSSSGSGSSTPSKT